MKHRAVLTWIVILTFVTQFVLGSPVPVAAASTPSVAAVQPALGMSELQISAPGDTSHPFALPAHYLFPVSGGAMLPNGGDSGPAGALRVVSEVDDLLTGPDTTTDEEGGYLFADLPIGTHKVTIDVSTLPKDVQPADGEEQIVLWINPGMELVSEALSTGVRLTAAYDRESGEIYGRVFVDQDGDGQQGPGETGVSGVRVIDPTLQQYFVPFDDRNLWAMFEDKAQCHNDGDRACEPLVSKVFISAGADNTVFFYDHWEDGYDEDPLIPGTTTEMGVLDAGATEIFESNILIAQIGQGPPYYHDGRDRITIYGDDASVVRLAHAGRYVTNGTCPGTPSIDTDTQGWLAGAWEVGRAAGWGTSYHSVVGEDLDLGGEWADDHDYSGLEVMAWQDGTEVYYNDVLTATINAGETFFVRGANNGAGGGGVDSPDHIEASAPVQVQMLTGACGQGEGPHPGGTLRVSAHGYTLLREGIWGNAYWVPVPGFDQSCNPNDYEVDTDIYIHNPDLQNAIEVTVFSGGLLTGTITVPAHTSVSVLERTGWPDLASGNRATFLRSDGIFWGVTAVDSATNGASGADDFDWGFGLLPNGALSSQVIVGYGPGRPEGRTDLVNGNSAFVAAAVTDTVIFVDLDQDGLADPFDMDGDGETNSLNVWGVPGWDEPVSALGIPIQLGQTLRVADPFDYTLRGARIYSRALDEHIAVAWGQDGCRATYLDYLDLGYTLLASPVPRLSKTDGLAVDADGTDGFSPGDTITYTLVLYNNGMSAMSDVVLTDTLPYTYTDFVVGSLQITTPPAYDSVAYYDGAAWGATSIPNAQQFRVTWPLIEAQDTVTLTFRAYIRTTVPVTLTELVNNAVVASARTPPITTTVRTPVQRPLLSITKLAEPGQVAPTGRVTYTVVVSNYGDGVALLTEVSDVLPPWLDYVSGTLDLTWPVARIETVTEVVTHTTFFHGFYGDDFDLNQTESTYYGGNDGSMAWIGDWTEIGDDDDPVAGTVQVRVDARLDGDALSAPGYVWMGDPVGTTASLERDMDLSLFQAPTLRYYPYGPDTNTGGAAYSVQVDGTPRGGGSYVGPYAVQEIDLSSAAGGVSVTLGFVANGTMGAEDFYRFDHISVHEADPRRDEQRVLSREVTTLEYQTVTGIDPVSYDALTRRMVITEGLRLPASGFITATFQVQAAIPLTNGLQLTNTTCVTSVNWIEILDPPCADAPVVILADHTLELTKTVEPLVAQAGSLLTYTISYVLAGDEAVETVVVSDTTPVSTTYVSASPTPLSAPAVGGTGAVLWQFPGLWPPGSGITEATGVMTMVVRVDPTVISGTIVNTAAITDSTGLTDTDTVTVPLQLAADLAIQKLDDPDPVETGGVLTYTLIYTNLGSLTAVDATISDTLPNEVTYGGVIQQPPGWTDPPNYSAGPPETLTWVTPTLAPGASGRIVYTVTVDPDFVGTVTNTVYISTTTPESRYDNNRDIEPTQVYTDRADVTITKADDVDPVAPGGQLVYTLVYTNNGPAPAENVVVSDTLPTEVAFASANPAPDSGPPNPLLWNLGTLNEGETGMITVAVTVGLDVTGTFTNPVNISTDTPETDYTNNDDIEPTDVVVDNVTDVTIVKSDNPDPVAQGGQLVYTLTYANNGPLAAENVVVTDTLPPEVTFVAASPTQASGPNPLVWNLGTLGAVQRGTIVVTVTVGADVTETFTNPVRISTDTPESNYENNDDEEPTDVLLADVMIVKTADTDMISPGTEFQYELEYSNIGALTATDVVVFDILPPELIFGEATPEQDEGPNPLVWYLGDLGPGQGGTITLTVTVTQGVTSEWITNTAVISTTTPETRYDNNRSSVDRPTAVEMLYYWAKLVPEGVLLKWETAWEVDSYGFVVLRSNSGRLGDASDVAFVPAAGHGQGGGATYSYLDRLEAGAIGREYTYWLAEVDTNGQRTIYGPMPVSAFRLSRLYGLPEAAVISDPYG